MDTGPAQRPAAFPAVAGPRVTVALIDIVVATPLAPTKLDNHAVADPSPAPWNVMKRGLAGDNLWVVGATSTGRPQ